MDKLTPAHEAWRKKLSEQYVTQARRDTFLAGMESEHEVASRIGALEILKAIFDETGMDNPLWKRLKQSISDGEADLAALLAKVEG